MSSLLASLISASSQWLSRLALACSRLLLACLLGLSAVALVGATSQPLRALEPSPPQLLFTLSDSSPAGVPRPQFSEQTQAVKLAVTAIETLEFGDLVAFDLGTLGRIALTIDRANELKNGDKVVEAHAKIGGSDVQLLLTFSGASLFGYLKTADEVFQLQAARGAQDYEGWFYRPTSLQGQQLQNDYVLIDHSVRDERERFPLLSLQNMSHKEDALKIESLNNAQSDLYSSQRPSIESAAVTGLSISHMFEKRAVYRGGSVVAAVTVTNTSASAANGHYFELYFLPEAAELSWGAADCKLTLSLSAQKVLRCNLGAIAARSVKRVELAVSTGASTPSLLQSTALLDETLRADASIRVVADVRLDSDLDGLSDFNEALLGTDANDSASLTTAPTVIDVIALYSEGAREAYSYGVETRINQLVAVANQTFINSGVDLLLRVVYHGAANSSDSRDMATTLDDLLARRGDAFNNIEILRSEYGGDIVLHFRPLEYAASRCGLAPVGGYGAEGDFSDPSERRYAAAVLAIDCPLDIVVAHEVGHLMGLTHSLREDGEGGTFDFATGYGIENQFATIMALPAAFGTAAQAGVFSSPSLACGDSRCGIAEGEAGASDAVSALNLVRHQIGRYSDSILGRLPARALKTLSGKATKASIAIGASRDGLRSLSNTVSVDDLVSLQAEVIVDPKHIAMRGSVHVLLALESSNDIYQLSSQGKVHLWDGTLEGLEAFGGSAPLNAIEQLTIMNRLRLGSVFAGERLAVFVAYQVASIDSEGEESAREIIYPQAPYWLSIEP